MKKRKWMTTLMTFASVAMLAACSSSNLESGSSTSTGTEIGDTFKIGYDLELSGSTAAYGMMAKNGADLAVKEINKAGGIDGKDIEIIEKDNKSETAEAATVATSLASKEGVNVIIGPMTSAPTGAAATKAAESGVPLISPSATQTGLTDGQSHLFRATFEDSYQGEILAKYLTDTLKADKVVLFADNSNDYAKGIAEAFEGAYTGKIVESLTFASGDTDFQAALTKIKDLDFDALVVPGYYTEAGLVTKQAREMGIDVPILGGDGFNDAKFIESATAANATDIYYVSGYSTQASDKAAKFAKAYKAEYGEEPSMFAALAYDSVYMAAKAAEGAKTSADVTANLEKLADFEGVTGTMTVDENHDVVKSAYMITLKDGKEAKVEEVK